MSKAFAVTLAVASCMLVACQDAVGPTARVPGGLAPFANEGVDQNFSSPIDLFVFISCAAGGAGETVHLTGDLHTLVNVTLDNAGGIKVKTHFQPQGISGLGDVTGAKYQGTGVTQDEFTAKFGFEETFVNNFRMIGQGPGNNFAVHENAHITVNANGVITVVHDNFSATCK